MTTSIEQSKPHLLRRWYLRFLVWLWVKRAVLVRWLRQQLGIDADMHLVSSALSLKEMLIDGLRQDHDTFVEAHRIMRQVDETVLRDSTQEGLKEIAKLQRRIKYYGDHNDSLRFTAKKFDAILQAEANERQAVKATEFVPKP